MLDAIALARRMENLRVQNAIRDARRREAAGVEDAAFASRVLEQYVVVQRDLGAALEFTGLVISCMMRAPEIPTWALPIAVALEDMSNERATDAGD